VAIFPTAVAKDFLLEKAMLVNHLLPPQSANLWLNSTDKDNRMWKNPEQSSYLDLRAKLRQKMIQDGQVKARLQALLTEVFEQTLQETQIVLSRAEKQRLSSQLFAEILTEFLTENKETHG
jgi:hypothetical protein